MILQRTAGASTLLTFATSIIYILVIYSLYEVIMINELMLRPNYKSLMYQEHVK